MTTRNFRVHNGISVGDIVIDATANTITGGATAAPSADGQFANKKFVDDSIAAISTTAITQGNSNVTVTDSGTGSIAIDLDGTDRLTIVAATTTTATGHSIVMGAGSNSAAGSIKFLEGTDNGTNGVTLIGPASTGDVTVTLPAAADTLVGKATTDTFTNKTIDANGTGNVISNIDIANMTAASVVLESEGIASNDNDTTLPTSASVKDYVDTQDGNIAADTLTFTNKTYDANATGNSLTNIDSGNMLSGFFLDEDNLGSNDATAVASQQSIKAYVDSGLSSLSSTTLTAGNTTAIVSDSGSNGAFTVTCDGNSELVINDTSATFSGNVVASANLTVTGNLTVNGDTTTVNTSNTTIADNLIELNTGISASSNDAGLIIERGSTGNNAAIIWDESVDKFAMGTTTATAADKSGGITVSTGTLVANLEGNVSGNVTGNTSGSSGSCTGTAAIATAITVTDNENTNENNVILFAAGAAGSGNVGAEADGNMTYNPSTGKITATGFVGDLTGTATAAQYSDVAERFASDSAYTPGTVVALGGAEEITQVNEEGSDEVFGVISSLDQAAFKMNGGAGNDDTHPYIAMTGRVDVKVIGTVSKGDRLISASVPGYAKAAIKSECTAFNVIGRALTSKTEAGQGSVLAAVRVSH